MQQQSHEAPAEIRDVLLEAYEVNDAMNQLLLANLDPRAWRAQLPEAKSRGGLTIGAILAHLHNSRLVWIKNSAPRLQCPAPVDLDRVTPPTKKVTQCLRMLTDALSAQPKRKVTNFSRGSWVPIWPAGGAMWAYMFSHEADHRGQILMLAHQLGYRFPANVIGGIWQWNRLWKQHRFRHRRR